MSTKANMDRVETLVQQLQQQFAQGASPAQLLLTTQMLQHELQHVQSAQPSTAPSLVAISMPVERVEPPIEIPIAAYKPLAAAPPPAPVPPAKPLLVEIPEQSQPEVEEKTYAILEVDESEIEAELEEIKRNAALIQQITVQSKPPMLFETAADEIPTLVLQNQPQPTEVKQAKEVKEVNEAVATEKTSLNDQLKTQSSSNLADLLTDTPVKDLKKAIGINDRFLYINELFRGDEVMYERSIKTINSFSIFPEAEYWIRRELKIKLGWEDGNETVQQFDQLVRRRFS